MWFKNLIIYRITNGTIDSLVLNEALASHTLQNCLQMEMQSYGWVHPKDDTDQFVHVYNQHALIAFGVEKKLLPSTVINQYAKDRMTTMAQHQGHTLSKRQAKDIKEAVLIELMPRAFVHRQMTYAWIDLTQGIIAIDTANTKLAEALVELLLKTVSGLRLSLFSTNTSPTTAMTRWLSGDEPPAVFTIDRDCELQGRDNEKSTIRYTHHDLGQDETTRHIRAGKQVTRLAMTWTDSISFVQQNIHIQISSNQWIKWLPPIERLSPSPVIIHTLSSGRVAFKPDAMAVARP